VFTDRQNRVRALEALDRASKQFRTRQEIWPLYAPREPVSMDKLLDQALAGARFDPLTLKAKTLLWLAWPGGVTWELWVIALPSGLKLYCDTGDDETRILASGRRDSEIQTDRLFLEILSESAGQQFGIELRGGPPSRVRSSLTERDVLIDFFVALFEEEGLEDQVHGVVPATGDFREDVAAWLSAALRAK
jgi:hypothetical protein